MRRIISRRLVAKLVAGLLRGIRHRRDLLLLLLLLLPERHAVVTIGISKLVKKRERRRRGRRVLVVERRTGRGAGRRSEIKGTPSWWDHGGVLQTDRVRRRSRVLRETRYTSAGLWLRADSRRDARHVLLLLLLLLALSALLRFRRRRRRTTGRFPAPARRRRRRGRRHR